MENILYVKKDHSCMLTAHDYNKHIKAWETNMKNLKDLCDFIQKGIYTIKNEGKDCININDNIIIDNVNNSSFGEILQDVSCKIRNCVAYINEFNPDDYDKYQFISYDK